MKDTTVYIYGYGRLPIFTWAEVCADSITYDGSEDGYDIYAYDDGAPRCVYIAVVPEF